MAHEQRDIVRILRQSQHFTQSELGAKVGISPSKLSLYETGLVDLTAAELRRVIRFLNYGPGPIKKTGTDAKTGTERKAISLKELMNPDFAKGGLFDEKTKRKFYRQRFGLSQRELAKKAKIPRNKLIKFEGLKVELTVEEKTRWEDALFEAAAEKKHADPYWHMERLHRKLKEQAELLKEERKQNELKDQIVASKDLQIRNLEEQVKAKEARIVELEEWQNAEETAALAHANAEYLREKAQKQNEIPARQKKETVPKDDD
jgi:transcriptional regulator with XRE-family HTH domain